jgi:hypothetical protein
MTTKQAFSTTVRQVARPCYFVRLVLRKSLCCLWFGGFGVGPLGREMRSEIPTLRKPRRMGHPRIYAAQQKAQRGKGPASQKGERSQRNSAWDYTCPNRVLCSLRIAASKQSEGKGRPTRLDAKRTSLSAKVKKCFFLTSPFYRTRLAG